MQRFTMGYETIEGVADSDFLDRLAERVYEIERLVDPLLGLNPDGSVTASFDLDADDPVEAVETGARLFFDAFVAAEPLRAPTSAELEAANQLAGVAAEQLRRQLLSSVAAEPVGRTRTAEPAPSRVLA